MCVWLTLILTGSLSTGVVFVDDESKASALRCANRLTKTLDAWRAYTMRRFMLCIQRALPPSLVENELQCLIPQDMAKSQRKVAA